jgi:hypothetical protein
MSNRVTKSSRKSSSRSALLAAILQSPETMPSCSSCEVRGISVCQVSDRDSSRCAECVRLGRAKCDVQGISSKELLGIAAQHQKLEAELEEAENKVFRLRKQKKLWLEKMMRAVRRGISSVEELEKVESCHDSCSMESVPEFRYKW